MNVKIERWLPVAPVVLVTGLFLGDMWPRGNPPGEPPPQATLTKPSISYPAKETVVSQLKPELLAGALKKIAQQSLEEKGTDGSFLSFREQTAKKGFDVSEFQDLGLQAYRGKAGKDGLLVRYLPTTDSSPEVKAINWGEPISWNAEVWVKNRKTGEINIFGLLSGFKLIFVEKLDPQTPDSLNLIKNPDGSGFYIITQWVRLGQQMPGKPWEWFVDSVQLAEYSKVLPKDGGAINYGRGVIGPSREEAEILNAGK